jgi:copper chaperone
MMRESIITLSRLNCSGCVRNVTNALQTLSDVEIVHTDILTKTVHLRYFDDARTLEQIKAVLAEARYPVVSEQLLPQHTADTGKI